MKMAGIIAFCTNNLIWFIIGSLIAIFALIGYFVDGGSAGQRMVREVSVERPTVQQETLDIEELNEPVADDNQMINQAIAENGVTLEETVSSNAVSEQVDPGVAPVMNEEYDRPLMEEDTSSTGFRG